MVLTHPPKKAKSPKVFLEAKRRPGSPNPFMSKTISLLHYIMSSMPMPPIPPMPSMEGAGAFLG